MPELHPDASPPPASPRRPARRRRLGGALLALALLTLTACGGAGDAPDNPLEIGRPPASYPPEYAGIVEASRAEGGTLVIYSNTDQTNWAPVLRDFQRKYPWVEDVQANNLGSDEVFERTRSEQATGRTAADVIVSNATSGWAEFASDPARLQAHRSPEEASLPALAPAPAGVHTMALDPVVIGYNRQLLPRAPRGFADLAAMVRADPELFRDRITVRDVEGSFGYTAASALTTARPQSWDSLRELLPFSRPESASGTQNEKVLAGEYVAGLMVAAAPAYPLEEDSEGLFSVAYPDDGTVVLPRGIGIPAGAPHSATARLFVDFVLSVEGQRAVAQGGLTAYRPEITPAPGLRTLRDLTDRVGPAALVVAPYAESDDEGEQAFLRRWEGLMAP